jgi:hypothetical protein
MSSGCVFVFRMLRIMRDRTCGEIGAIAYAQNSSQLGKRTSLSGGRLHAVDQRREFPEPGAWRRRALLLLRRHALRLQILPPAIFASWPPPAAATPPGFRSSSAPPASRSAMMSTFGLERPIVEFQQAPGPSPLASLVISGGPCSEPSAAASSLMDDQFVSQTFTVFMPASASVRLLKATGPT